MSTKPQAEIYDVYESETVNGNPSRWYWANVDTPQRGKILAELITEHEGRQVEWGQETLFPRPTIHFESAPLVGFGATVYTVDGQVKVCVIIINPVETSYSLM